MREKQQNKGTIEISDSVLDIAHEVVEKCHVKHFYRRDGKVDELMNKSWYHFCLSQKDKCGKSIDNKLKIHNMPTDWGWNQQKYFVYLFVLVRFLGNFPWFRRGGNI